MKNFVTQCTVSEIIAFLVILMVVGILSPAFAEGRSFYSPPPSNIQVRGNWVGDSLPAGKPFIVEVSFSPKECMTYDGKLRYAKKLGWFSDLKEIHIEIPEKDIKGCRSTAGLSDPPRITKRVTITNPPNDPGIYDILVFFVRSLWDKDESPSYQTSINFINPSNTMLGKYVPDLKVEKKKEVLCDKYARKAVAQYKKSQDAGCRNIPARSSRWHSNYNEHYNWCLRGDMRVADEETRIRERLTEQCLAASCVLYEDHGFRGQTLFIEPGERYPDLGRVSWDKRVSSVKVPPGCILVLHTLPYHQGGRLIPDRTWFELGSWDDQISSAECSYR